MELKPFARLPRSPERAAATVVRSVLIVDDDRSWLVILGRQLEMEGFHVKTAASVASAMRELEKGNPTDLIICDLHMPRADGLELCDALLSLRDGRPIPFIFVSSLRDAQSVAAANALGVPHFLEKRDPIVDLVDLARSITG